MNKQYLISLLGFTTIFAPFTNCLLNVNSTYINNNIKTESIIDQENSKVIVQDLDLDGQPSQGDQIDQIQLNTNYNEFYSIYEDKTETILSNEYGLNIYTENSTNTIKPFYSISYDRINNLNLNQNEGYLNLDLNSTDNPTWEIWDAKLPDNSQEFIITAKKQENNHQEKIIENNIGEVPITSYVNNRNLQKEPKIVYPTAEVDSLLNDSWVTIEYKVDCGDTGEGLPLKRQKYVLKEINITNRKDNNEILYENRNPAQHEASRTIILSLTPNKDYELIMHATFVNPNNNVPIFKTSPIAGGIFNTFDAEDPDPTPPDPIPPIPTPPGPSSNNTMIIIGIIAGVILFVVIISVVGYYLYKKNK